MKNHTAWNTLAWFATLVALADGLNRVGFVKWFADAVAAHMDGFTPFTAMVVLVLVFYFTHYLFASVTAHYDCAAAGDAGRGFDHRRHRRWGCSRLCCA